MTYLIAKQNKKLNIYIPAIYGCETWGNRQYQESLKKKRKSWYITSWQYGGGQSDDITNSYKLKVIYETDNLLDAIKYLHEAGVSEEETNCLLDHLQKQMDEFIAFENRWR